MIEKYGVQGVLVFTERFGVSLSLFKMNHELFTTSPSMEIVPAVISSSPAIMRSRVDLPQPDVCTFLDRMTGLGS